MSDQTTEEDPGGFLRRILTEMPEETHGFQMARVLFMSALPPSAKGHLAALDSTTLLQTLADIGNRIPYQERLTTDAPANLFAAILVPPNSMPANPITAIPLPPTNKMMEGWDAKLAAVVSAQTTPRTRFRNHSPAPSKRQGEYCYYHHTFGKRARKCKPPAPTLW